MEKSTLKDIECLMCKHLMAFTGGCMAYPKGIPYKLTSGLKLHHEILPDQIGNYTFEIGEPKDITELEILRSYLEKGEERFKNETFSIDDYIRLCGDAVIFWDMFFNDFSKKIETIKQSDFIGWNNVLEKLKLTLNLKINDPFSKNINPSKYGVAQIERLQHILSMRLQEPVNSSKKNFVDNYEIALKHWLLEKAKIEPMIFGEQIVNRYGAKKVEVFVNELRKNGVNKSKKNILSQLTNVKNSLNDYPEIQKELVNLIDELS